MSFDLDARLEALRQELEELMHAQLESLKTETFGGLSEDESRRQGESLSRIREVSADFLMALKEKQRDR